MAVISHQLTLQAEQLVLFCSHGNLIHFSKLCQCVQLHKECIADRKHHHLCDWNQEACIYIYMYQYLVYVVLRELFSVYTGCSSDSMSLLPNLAAGPVRDFHSSFSVSKEGCYACRQYGPQ